MRIIAGAVGACLLCAGASAQPSAETLKFAIMRKGDQIGTHTVSVQPGGAETSVKIATHVAVKIAFITAYEFDHSSSEKWANGRLVSLHATTDDNGTAHKLDIGVVGRNLRIEADGKTTQAAADTIPASLWNPALLHRSTALSTLDGSLMHISVADKGLEEVEVQGRPTKAHHYFIDGPFPQDVWYDEGGRLVQVRFKGRDGSDVFYRLT